MPRGVDFTIPMIVGVKRPEGTEICVMFAWKRYGQEDSTYAEYIGYAKCGTAEADSSWVIQRYYWIPSQVLGEGRVVHKITVRTGPWEGREGIDWEA